jgi:hypothetical protein
MTSAGLDGGFDVGCVYVCVCVCVELMEPKTIGFGSK